MKLINPLLYVFTGIYDYELNIGESNLTARNLAVMGTCLPAGFLVLSTYLILSKLLNIEVLSLLNSLGEKIGISSDIVWVIFVIPQSILVIYISCIKGKKYILYYENNFSNKYFSFKSVLVTLGCLFFSFFCMYLFG
ncbi:MAG: hypothetical protein JKX78_06735 [Alteromonadaceae bacterium]|nr:hypothetical protein [Alteromonadaceae bacterium]